MTEKSSGSSEEVEKTKEFDDDKYVERCACGHDRHHHMVTPKPTYSSWGAFSVTLIGASATPTRIDFLCRVCKEKFDWTTDPEELKQFM